ncbi:CBO0543 family protein [Oceanobacillus senegalensis]|uniref:CBO0543 family protein n=1 Tax=Oceanobacillus senegalensis TaxID=1936063 RepID=UPI000A30A6EA|nr:CBO0543 family protein [Oceanobacillus senegalensis]
MESIILWGAFIAGVAMLFFILPKLPFKDWLIIFLFTSYVSVIAGTVVVEEKMLSYPVKILEKHFESSLQFEMLTLPVICLYFYKTTYHSTYTGTFLQGLLYTSALTLIEVLLETYTNIIEYHTWTWLYTFISVFILIVFVRYFMDWVNKNA